MVYSIISYNMYARTCLLPTSRFAVIYDDDANSI